MLEKLTDSTAETERKWIRFMLERVGHNNLPRLIEYYESIGWISSSMGDRLLALAKQEKRCTGTSWTLSAKEHRISRLFIEKLEGKRVDESVLSIPQPRSPVSESGKKLKDDIHLIHPLEKKNMEFAIHRREVTISNLEQELEDRYHEINRLRRTVQELKHQLDECQEEVKKNRIFMEILDQNTRLRKVERVSRRSYKNSDMINHNI